MSPHDLFADAAWFRLAVVGIDILAVIAIVRIWSMISAWWSAAMPRRLHPRPAPVRARHARKLR